MEDAGDLKSSVRKDLQVRILPPAPSLARPPSQSPHHAVLAEEHFNARGVSARFGQQVAGRDPLCGGQMEERQHAGARAGGHPAGVAGGRVPDLMDERGARVEAADLVDEQIDATRRVREGVARPRVPAVRDAGTGQVHHAAGRGTARWQVIDVTLGTTPERTPRTLQIEQAALAARE